jgi:hypothetical protein
MNIEEDFRFDVRIQQRLLKKGLVQESELSARLAGLKDLENECEPMEVEQPGVTPVEPEAPETELP